MSDEINDMLDSIEIKHFSGDEFPEKKPSKASFWHVKRVIETLVVLGALGLLIVGGGGIWFFGMEYLTKRQDYPIRRVLYQCQESVYFAGGEETRTSSDADRENVTIITAGNSDGTKLGPLLGISKYEIADEVAHYQLEDEGKTRIVYGTAKRELVQAGLRFSGGTNFTEKYSELIGKPGKFLTYSFVSDRARRNIEINVLADEKGGRRVVNELVTYRSIPLGVLWGAEFRDRTELNEFPDIPENKVLFPQLLGKIDHYNSQGLSDEERESLVKSMLEIEEKLHKIPIYVSHEDGIVDYLPQESTTYLFLDPNNTERFKSWIGTAPHPAAGSGQPVYPRKEDDLDFKAIGISNPARDLVRIRVENEWDLFPGNFWGLNKIEIGEQPNVIRPFSHRNNGGYVIKDGQGEIAKIEIKDFWLHYGNDLLYKYYLDKNADGEIDEEQELIGQVLYHVSRDEGSDIEKEIGEGEGKKDITQRVIYSFMAGSDWDKRVEEFYLCNAIESFIVNELNRGFGKHSEIGWINSQRSTILLLQSRSSQNLARAMTPESSLVAKQDIVALMRATGRDYVEKYISDEGTASANAL